MFENLRIHHIFTLAAFTFLLGIVFGFFSFLSGVVLCVMCFVLGLRMRVFFFITLACALGLFLSYAKTKQVDMILHNTLLPAKNEQFRIDNVQEGSDGQRIYISGKNYPYSVYFKYSRYPSLQIGDVIRLQCDYKKPEPFDGFAYDRYLAYRNVTYICGSPYGVEVIGNDTSIFDHVSALMTTQVKKIFLQPTAGFFEGLVLGNKGGVDEDIVSQFRITGLSHVIVISGMHIAIVSSLVSRMFFFLRGWRKFFIQVSLLIVYLGVIGFPPSAIRGVIMGSMLLLSEVVKRRRNALNILLLAAILMSLWKPHGLLVDAGFQLSFAATAGLLFFKPIVDRWLDGFPELFGYKETLSASLAAIIFTTPLSSWLFGQFSLIAPIANIIVVPFVAFILLGAIACLALSFIPSLAIVFSYPLHIFVLFLFSIVQRLSDIHYASIVFPDFHFVFVILMYIPLALLIVLNQKER